MGIKKKFKVAFIGSGYMSREHIKVFSTLKNKFNIQGIIGRKNITAKKISKEFDIKYVCTSIKELYLKTQADLVVIAVPELEVKKVCLEAFKYPWKMLIEKPIGLNLNEAKIIYNNARKNKVSNNITIALNRRNYTSTLQALKLLKSDNSRRYIQIYDQQDMAEASVKKYSKIIRNNWMYKNPIHLIDYLNIFGRGKIKSVEKIKIFEKKKLHILNSHITFSSGDIGQYNSVWNMPGPWAVVITTKFKRFEIRPLEILKYQKRGSRKLENIKINYNNDIKFKAGLFNQASNVYLFLNNKKNNLVKIKESLLLMHLINKIYK